MEYKDFPEAMRRLVRDNGKDALLIDDHRKLNNLLSDYGKRQFSAEANGFMQLLKAGCAKYINDADDVLICKRTLVKRMDEEYGISRNFSMRTLDLLGFLIKGDESKCREEPGDDLVTKGDAARDVNDHAKAVECYQKAEKQGNAEALYNIGYCYYYGQGLPKNIDRALENYKKSAELGYAKAQCELGGFYYRGEGFTQDYAKAVTWWRKAAEQGNADAQYCLGGCYADGNGVEEDDVKAAGWYRKAADLGQMFAMLKMAWLYKWGRGVKRDYAEAYGWFLKTAETYGWPDAQYHVGRCLIKGIGVPKDYKKGVEWLREAVCEPKAEKLLELLELNGGEECADWVDVEDYGDSGDEDEEEE